MFMWRFALLLLLTTASPVIAAVDKDGRELPLPRFASLKSAEVNLRAGPGSNYPIEWVLTRPALPIEIIAEFETWRRIRDPWGTVGWVHQSMLSGRRTGIVIGDAPRPLRRDPQADSVALALVEPGVLAQLLKCGAAWCRVDLKGRRGWLPRTDVWGLYEREAWD
jgi:SH3-like domain-containing protein